MKRLLLPVSLLALVLLSGCLDLAYQQEFRADGSSSLTYTMDFAKTVKLVEQASETQKQLQESQGPSVSWTVEINYLDEESGLTKTETGFLSGTLDTADKEGTLYCSIGGFTCKASGKTAEAGGSLKLDLTNEMDSAIVIRDILVEGDNAPSDCQFPADASSGAEAGAALAPVMCTGITTPKQEEAKDSLAEFQKTLDQMCVNITTKNPDVSCRKEGYKIIAGKEFKNGEGYSFTKSDGFPNIKYSVEVSKLPAFSGGESALGGGVGGVQAQGGEAEGIEFKNETTAAGFAMLASSGIEVTYTVKMPGKIVKAEGGSIDEKENTAEFDVLELVKDGENAVVESEELNAPYVAGAGTVGLIVLVLLVYFLVLKPPPSVPAAAPPLAP